EAIGVGDIGALEGWQQVLAASAAGAMVDRRLIDPEAGLAPDVQVANRVESRFVFEASVLLKTAAVAATALGQGPGDVEGVAVAVAFVRADFDALGQIEFDGDAGGGHAASVRLLQTKRGSGVSLRNPSRRGTEGRFSPAFHTQKRKSLPVDKFRA